MTPKSQLSRAAEIKRKTSETDIQARINLDGKGESSIDTGIPFMDHMLTLFARHGFFDLEIKARGDIQVDYHHLMEDLGLVLGEALSKAVGDKASIRRYGHVILPMDEALVLVALDLSGRPFLSYDLQPPSPRVKDIDSALFNEFFRAFTNKAAINLHIKMLSGEEIHHVFEAVFKGLAKALSQAVSLDERIKGVLSTKGSLD